MILAGTGKSDKNFADILSNSLINWKHHFTELCASVLRFSWQLITHYPSCLYLRRHSLFLPGKADSINCWFGRKEPKHISGIVACQCFVCICVPGVSEVVKAFPDLQHVFTGKQGFLWSSAHGLQLHFSVQQTATHSTHRNTVRYNTIKHSEEEKLRGVFLLSACLT